MDAPLKPDSKAKLPGKIHWLEIIWTLFSLLILVVLILKFVVFQQVSVVGNSMVPNYFDGELLLVNQLDKNHPRGQVVAVYADRNVAKDANYFTRFSATFFLKRVIGLPGESIEIVGSKVIIYNSQNPQGGVLVEDYIPQSTKNSEDARKYYYPKTKIPEKKYFVMGDNRSNSTDSRSSNLGMIDDFGVFGNEAIRFWPLENTTFFSLPTYSFEKIDSELLKNQNQFFLHNQNLGS